MLTYDEAAERLKGSFRGRNAMRRLLEWLDDDGLGLDAANQEAVFALLDAAWGPKCGSTMDAMREALR
jgi:hypothetical protein